MEIYDYRKAVIDDIRDYVRDRYMEYDDIDRDMLYEEMFVSDEVTGNASGSYTFDSKEAQDHVYGNEGLLKEAVREFCCDLETIVEHLADYEWQDVTIRCHLLSSCIDEALDGLIEDSEE